MKEQELAQLLKKYDEAYYAGQGIVEDDVYDFLQRQLKEINPDHPQLKKVDAKIVSKIWKKGTHNIHMGSQRKALNIEELKKEFFEKHDPRGGYALEEKLDGLSTSLDYNETVFVCGKTRGEEGIEGEIITRNMMKMNFPKVIEEYDNVSFRAEIMLSHSNFQKINQIFESEGEKTYSNPRNAATGIARNSSGRFCELLNVIVYDTNKVFNSEQDKLLFINDNFPVNTVEYIMCINQDTIIKTYLNYIENIRPNLDYDIDGLVIKIDNSQYSESLGMVDNRPKGQIALKFPAKEYITEVEEIIIQIGKTRRITPVAIVKPVEIDGRIIVRASCYNFERMNEKGIVPGSIVKIVTSGDIIPKITDVIENRGEFEIPEYYEGKKVIRDGVNYFLEDDNSDSKIKQITHYIRTIGVKDINEKFIETLYNNGLIKEIVDLYNVPHMKMVALEGIGSDTAGLFNDEIKRTATCTKQDFIVGLGIDGLASYNTEKVLKHFGDKFNIFGMLPNLSEIIDLEDTVNRILKSFNEKYEMIKKLEQFITFKEVKDVLKEKSFCITGPLARKREQYIQIIKENGGVYKTGVSMELDYLVTNDTKETGKYKKALDYGIRIITEDELVSMVGGMPDAGVELW